MEKQKNVFNKRFNYLQQNTNTRTVYKIVIIVDELFDRSENNSSLEVSFFSL